MLSRTSAVGKIIHTYTLTHIGCIIEGQTGKNFHLIEVIKNLAARLRFDFDMPVSIHWIPSNIEKTICENRHIKGNHLANQLA